MSISGKIQDEQDSVISQTHFPRQGRQNDSVSASNSCHRLKSCIILGLQFIRVGLLVLSSIKGTFNFVLADSNLSNELLSQRMMTFLMKTGYQCLSLQGSTSNCLLDFVVPNLNLLSLRRSWQNFSCSRVCLDGDFYNLWGTICPYYPTLIVSFSSFDYFDFSSSRIAEIIVFLKKTSGAEGSLCYIFLGTDPSRRFMVQFRSDSVIWHLVRRCQNYVTFLCMRLLVPFFLLSSSLCFYCIKINITRNNIKTTITSVLLIFLLNLTFSLHCLFFQPAKHVLLHLLLSFTFLQAKSIIRERNERIDHGLVELFYFLYFGGYGTMLSRLITKVYLLLVVFQDNLRTVNQIRPLLTLIFSIIYQNLHFFQIQYIIFLYILVAAFNRTNIRISFGIVISVKQSQIGEGIMLTIFSSGWISDKHRSVQKIEDQRKGFLTFCGVEVQSIFCGHLFTIYSEMIVIQILYLSFSVLHLLTDPSFTLKFNHFLDLSPQLQPIIFGTVKYIISFRIDYIISQHHQKFILLELLYQNLTVFAQLSLELFDRICVIADEMPEHALLVAIAKNWPFEGLLCFVVCEFQWKVIFYSKNRIILKDLQLKDILIVHEVSSVVESSVESWKVVGQSHVETHLFKLVVLIHQFLLNQVVYYSMALNDIFLLGSFFIVEPKRVVEMSKSSLYIKLFATFVDPKIEVIFILELQQQLCQLFIHVLVESMLQLFNFLYFLTKLILRQIFIQQLKQLLNCDDLFFCQQLQMSYDFLPLAFLLQSKHKYFAHHSRTLITDRPQSWQIFFLIFEVVEHVDILFEEGQLFEFVEVGDDH